MSAAAVARSGRRRVRGWVAASCTTALLGMLTVLGTAGVARAETGVLAYVTDQGANLVDVLDTSTNTVTATIPVGNAPSFDAVSPDGTRLYVANSGGDTVSVIDTASLSVLANVPVGTDPQQVAVSWNGQSVYVTDQGSNTVSVISAATDAVTATIPVVSSPYGLALNPSGTTAYVAGQGGPIQEIDTTSNTVTGTFPADAVEGIAVNPAGTQLWVCAGNEIDVYDIATGALLTVLETGTASLPASIAFSADGTTAWAAEEDGEAILKFDTATLTGTAIYDDTEFNVLTDIAVTPDGSEVYAPGGEGHSGVMALTTATGTTSYVSSGFSDAYGIATVPPPTPAPTAPLVTGLSPNGGTSLGGTTVTITGSGLRGATAVDFDSTPATAYTVRNDDSITATAPAESGGTVDVTVTTPLGTSPTSSTDRYTYTAPSPTVTGISPNTGSTVGGATVAITGSAFTGATAVDFGSTPATTYTVRNDDSITATAPAETAGTVDVTVTTPVGTSATGPADTYTYTPQPAPSVTGLSPGQGPDTGGTSVTISGVGFTNATSVRFGTTAVTSFVVNDDTTITVTTPKHALGTVDVTVTTPIGTSTINAADSYTFALPAPTISSLKPDNGPPSGGTVVTITGHNLTGTGAVLFGTTPASAFTVASNTSITATAPAGTGIVDVTVTTPSGTSATVTGDRYTYDAADLTTAITTTGTPALGSFYSYTATVTNSGPLAATGTTLTATLSGTPGDNIITTTRSQGSCSISGQTVTCAVGTLKLDATATIAILVEPLATGTITASDTVTAAQTDTDPADETATATAEVTNADGCTLIGTPGPDTLTASGDNAGVCGLSGDDTISSGTGNYVTTYLGSGTDTATAGPGDNETIYAGTGADTIITQSGTGDVIYAGDYLYPGAHTDTIHASTGTTCYTSTKDHISGCSTIIYN